MADMEVRPEPEAIPVEDLKIKMEAKAKEYAESQQMTTRADSGGHILVTVITNLSRSGVSVSETHFWHGRKLDPISDKVLPPNLGIVYQQIGTLPEGVKWGLVYVDGSDSTARKFVIAVDVPKAKIYVEAGPIGPVDWNVIEVKLDQHSGSKAEYTDPILGGKVVAEATGHFATAWFYN